MTARDKPARRTQRERREATRRALLDATVECLAEVGYAKTTTSLVCERAGLSRGAHLHHFGTRAALVSAGVAHLGDRALAEMDAGLAALPEGPDHAARALDVLWGSFTHALFPAALELWAAARTDPELAAELAPVEHEFGQVIIRRREQLFPEQADRPDFPELVDYVLSTIRGLALLRVIQPSHDTSVERWEYARARLLEVLEGTQPLPAAAGGGDHGPSSRSTRG